MKRRKTTKRTKGVKKILVGKHRERQICTGRLKNELRYLILL